MRLIKYGEGWTRRHFMGQLAKGVAAAGLLTPLFDVIGRNGDCAAAYPPELLSIEAYTKGKLKAGDVLNADNVDLVKDIIDEVAYWQVKYDKRTIDLIATETDVTKLLRTLLSGSNGAQQGGSSHRPRRQRLDQGRQTVDRRQPLSGGKDGARTAASERAYLIHIVSMTAWVRLQGVGNQPGR